MKKLYYLSICIVMCFKVHASTPKLPVLNSNRDGLSNKHKPERNARTLAAFNCDNLAYQVAGPISGNSTLYSYDVKTGVRTTIAALGFKANAIGYNTLDNLIWGYNQATNMVVTIDALGASESFNIPNLPNNEFNIGAVLPDGYLFLYFTSTARYYIVDINPARATYLSMVDPVAGFVVDASPYGTPISPALNVSDMAYNINTGMLYGLVNPGSANQYRLATLNPLTGNVTFSSTQVSNAGIQGEAEGYGSIFTDAIAGNIYVFANTQGRFYKIDIATSTATLLSTPGSAFNNDGTNCPTANLTTIISGAVLNDVNGITDGLVNGTSSNLAGLHANLLDASGNVIATVPVDQTTGAYIFDNVAPGTYMVQLNTVIGTIGMAAPGVVLPSGWVNTGDVVPTGTAENASPSLSEPIIVGSDPVTNVNFGMQQPPSAISGSLPSQVNPGGTNTVTVPNVSFDGNDQSGGTISKLTISAFPTNATTIVIDGVTYYDPSNPPSVTTGMTAFPGSGVDVPVDANGHPSVAIAIDPIDGAIESEITYTATDNAGATSPTGTVTVPFTSPLPVTLLSFTAAKTEGNSTLTWITAEESNSDHFEIQHSLDATRWTAAGKVNASGESHAVKNYKFVHTAPVAGLNYYRLKMIDRDETFAYSRVAMVRFEGDYDISLYPNPASSLLMIHNLGLKVINSIEIIDLTGRSVFLKKDKSDSKNTFAGGIDISNLTNGAYIVRLSADDTTVITRKIVIRH